MKSNTRTLIKAKTLTWAAETKTGCGMLDVAWQGIQFGGREEELHAGK